MKAERTIDFMTRGIVVPGGGSPVRRYLGTPELSQIDPFLLLDWFEIGDASRGPGFAPHPHRGIDTLTLMIEGGMEHFDNIGNVQAVGAGGAQLMRAGRGILHAERPLADGGRLFGLQLWINLARSEKTAPPTYEPLAAETIPVEERPGAKVRVIMGRTAGGSENATSARVTEPIVLDVMLEAGGVFSEPVAIEREGFVIVLEGEAAIGGRALARGVLGRMGPGGTMTVTSDAGARVVLVSGKPLNEPVARSGPFVMNSRDEVLDAYEDYRAGGFGPSIAVPPAIS